MSSQGHEVALFIDFENIHTSIVRNTELDAYHVDWRILLDGIESFGRIVIRRAYSNWGENAKHQMFLNRFAIEPKNAFGARKNVSDIYLAVEAMETLYTHPEIGTYILVSGDGDFSILVQRLRNHHKRVIGLGVRGTTSRGLIEACDEFIFYDDLLHAANGHQPQVIVPQVQEEEVVIEIAEEDVALDDLEADLRDQLQAALPEDGTWINGATLIYQLRSNNRTFDDDIEAIGYERFRDFLEAVPEIAEIRSAPGKGHMEVRLAQATAEPIMEVQVFGQPPADVDEPTFAQSMQLDDYIAILEEQNPRVTPNTHRPNIILRIHEIMSTQSIGTLNKLKAVTLEDMQRYEDVTKNLVEEIFHQLYHTYSFEFEKLPDVPQWDRPCSFQPHIESRFDLLDNCDVGILKRLIRGLPKDATLDPVIVARLLYGRDDNNRILKRSEDIVEAAYQR